MGSLSPTKTTAKSLTFVVVAMISLTIVCISLLWLRLALAAGPHTRPYLELVGVSSPRAAAITSDSAPISSHVSVPGVFPSTDPSEPPAVDSGIIPDFSDAWSAAYQKARAKIANWTLRETVSAATGVGWGNGLCVGNIPNVQPVDGKGWPGLCLEDSPLGVRWTDFVTAFPTAINAAATFNRQMIRLRGLFMGKEHRAKGVNVALGPMMNMGRVAQGGRNWEGFGGDPFLSGEASYETILGMQEAGVQACAKHLVGNEQEHARQTSSSNIDDRTMHEVYAHPFLKSVMAGVASMMCSYNRLNGTYACEDDKVLNDILKREYGFKGYVMSDWGATHSTMSAAKGLDMTMPGDIIPGTGTSYFGLALVGYVMSGIIPRSRVDDMATRILAAWYFVHQDSPTYPPPNFNAFKPLDDSTNEHVDAQGDGDHANLTRKMGAASTVLLKNIGGALPLKRGDGKRGMSLALVGSDAGPGRIGPNRFPDQGGVDGILAMGWGSGTATFPYLISPLEALQARARKERTTISWALDDYDLETASNIVKGKSAALVFIQSDSGEEYITVDGNQGDRNNLTAWHDGDRLVLTVAAQNNNTIVVAHSPGPLILEPWIEHPNVTAVLWAGLPGQEAGNSLVDVLYGDWNPSGRLPYTIAKRPEDYSAQLAMGRLDIPYSEGLEIDYRHFDAHNIAPRFEFGFGLSYTTFEYANLHIEQLTHSDDTYRELKDAWHAGKASPVGPGSSAAIWLHRPAYNVTFEVTNAGKVFGGDIPQLYVHMPPSAASLPSLLKGFTNVELAPDERKCLFIAMSLYDLSVWDTVAQGWKKPQGDIRLSVGRSSRDFKLDGLIP